MLDASKMGNESTPSAVDLLRSKKARDELTLPQLHDLYEKLKTMAAGTGNRFQVEPNPADFAMRLSSGKWHIADHLKLLSDNLAMLEAGKIKQLMVSMPPRHGKSELMCVWTPVWWLTRNPQARIILVGYGEHFAREWGAKVRNKILEFSDDLNLMIDKEHIAADAWNTTVGGEFRTFGTSGSIVGRGADLYIIDDPIKNAEEANSETYRERLWNFWMTGVVTRRQPGAKIIVIATRWHQDDLLGRLVDADEDKDWTVVNLPALAEKEDALGRKEGEALWPEFWEKDGGAQYYEKLKRTMIPYWWNAQYQGRPTPEGGGILLRDDWQWYRKSDLPEKLDQICQSWDLPLKDKRTSDYAAGQVWGRSGADMFLIDSVRDHLAMEQVIHHMTQFAFKYKAVGKLIEDTAMAPALIHTFQHKVPGMIPVPPKGSKMSRVLNAVPYLKGHNIYLPMNDDGTKPKWVLDFIEECAAFDKGTYDDQVDTFTQAVTFLQPGLWKGVKEAATEAEQEVEEAKRKDPNFLRKQQAQWFSERIVRPALKKAAKRHNGTTGGMRKMW